MHEGPAKFQSSPALTVLFMRFNQLHHSATSPLLPNLACIGNMARLNNNTAVFFVAQIPEDMLNDFFRTAYSAPKFADEGVDDVGT